MEKPRQIPCPQNAESCKYAPACHLSEHHIYTRRNADSRLKREFGNLAINKIIACRMIHDLLDTLPPPEFPEPSEMRRAIERGQDDGA